MMCEPVRFLRYTIQDSAAAAAPEDHRIRPLESFDPLEVVEVAEILRIVAHAVYEEIGCGIVAADGDLVAIPFSLPHRCTRNEARYVGEALHRLILRELPGDRHHGLRDIARKRRRFSPRAGVPGRIPGVTPAGTDLDGFQLLSAVPSNRGAIAGTGVLGSRRDNKKARQEGANGGEYFHFMHYVARS